MVGKKVIVGVRFCDHQVGKDLVVYGELEESKLDHFETNEDYWITLTDSRRSLVIPKMDVTRIFVLHPMEEKFMIQEEASDFRNKMNGCAAI